MVTVPMLSPQQPQGSPDLLSLCCGSVETKHIHPHCLTQRSQLRGAGVTLALLLEAGWRKMLLQGGCVVCPFFFFFEVERQQKAGGLILAGSTMHCSKGLALIRSCKSELPNAAIPLEPWRGIRD